MKSNKRHVYGLIISLFVIGMGIFSTATWRWMFLLRIQKQSTVG